MADPSVHMPALRGLAAEMTATSAGVQASISTPLPRSPSAGSDGVSIGSPTPSTSATTSGARADTQAATGASPTEALATGAITERWLAGENAAVGEIEEVGVVAAGKDIRFAPDGTATASVTVAHGDETEAITGAIAAAAVMAVAKAARGATTAEVPGTAEAGATTEAVTAATMATVVKAVMVAAMAMVVRVVMADRTAVSGRTTARMAVAVVLAACRAGVHTPMEDRKAASRTAAGSGSAILPMAVMADKGEAPSSAVMDNRAEAVRRAGRLTTTGLRQSGIPSNTAVRNRSRRDDRVMASVLRSMFTAEATDGNNSGALERMDRGRASVAVIDRRVRDLITADVRTVMEDRPA